MNASARPAAPATVTRADLAGADGWVQCPDCGDLATVEWRRNVAGRDHVKVRCLRRHWFLLLAESVTAFPTTDAERPVHRGRADSR